MGFKSLFKRRKYRKTTMSPSSLLSLSMQPPLSLSSLHPRATEELKYVFRKFDPNGDGLISASELGAMMLGNPFTEEDLKNMIHEVDADGDGYINVKEFIELNTKGVDSDEALQNIKDAFAIFDIDGNGYIGAQELHQVMTSLGDECSMEDCKKMISAFDADADGAISFEDFKTMMMNAQK